ncbi:BTB/POZ fold domain containing protein [Apiospora hydei]|uniref:BTB/POZ fold domain containing protein n=1 Tax=Apiospora hydei TaxID=1337664 RepID=A0ABR1V1P4_9PEZI
MPERLNESPHAQGESSQTFSNKDGPIRLQGRWKNYTTPDGVVFVDADGSLFKDVLAYLRTGTFPLFFDALTKSFDYARYQALLGRPGSSESCDWRNGSRSGYLRMQSRCITREGLSTATEASTVEFR